MAFILNTYFKHIIGNQCIFQRSISLTSSYNRYPPLAVVRLLDFNFLQIIFSQGTCAKGCQHMLSSSSCNPSNSYVKTFLQSAQFPLLRTLRTRTISYFSELSVRILVSCSLIIHVTQLPVFSFDSNPKPWFYTKSHYTYVHQKGCKGSKGQLRLLSCTN